MADIEITATETTPTYTNPYGGGRRAATHTQINPTYVYPYGGGRRGFSYTEINPEWEVDPGIRGTAGLPAPIEELLL